MNRRTDPRTSRLGRATLGALAATVLVAAGIAAIATLSPAPEASAAAPDLASAAPAAWLASSLGTAVRPSEQSSESIPVSIDLSKVMGADACGECHTYEMAAWQKSTHFATFSTMHGKARAKEISEAMGERSIKRNDLCFRCHYTAQIVNDSPKSISGVSCESCHGAAQDWISPTLHHEKAKDITDAAAKEKFLQQCEAVGMLRPANIYRVARNCYSCHSVPHEKLVNTGGHKAGSDFDLVAWSQGEVRHNYLHSSDQANRPATKERLRVMFVVGVLTDLEYSLRGLAKATGDGAYQKAMTKRMVSAVKTLHDKIFDAVELPSLKAAVPEKSNKVLLGLRDDPATALAAAEKLSKATEAWAATADGTKLAGVDSLLPAPSAYHGTAQP